jgi:hypothetical protein
MTEHPPSVFQPLWNDMRPWYPSYCTRHLDCPPRGSTVSIPEPPSAPTASTPSESGYRPIELSTFFEYTTGALDALPGALPAYVLGKVVDKAIEGVVSRTQGDYNCFQVLISAVEEKSSKDTGWGYSTAIMIYGRLLQEFRSHHTQTLSPRHQATSSENTDRLILRLARTCKKAAYHDLAGTQGATMWGTLLFSLLVELNGVDCAADHGFLVDIIGRMVSSPSILLYNNLDVFLYFVKAVGPSLSCDAQYRAAFASHLQRLGRLAMTTSGTKQLAVLGLCVLWQQKWDLQVVVSQLQAYKTL